MAEHPSMMRLEKFGGGEGPGQPASTHVRDPSSYRLRPTSLQLAAVEDDIQIDY